MVRGLILGQFKWRWRPAEEPSVERDCVTTLLDVDPKSPGDFMYFGNRGGLIRAEESRGSYLFIGAEGLFEGSWEEVVQTVKRLARVTSCI